MLEVSAGLLASIGLDGTPKPANGFGASLVAAVEELEPKGLAAEAAGTAGAAGALSASLTPTPAKGFGAGAAATGAGAGLPKEKGLAGTIGGGVEDATGGAAKLNEGFFGGAVSAGVEEEGRPTPRAPKAFLGASLVAGGVVEGGLSVLLRDEAKKFGTAAGLLTDAFALDSVGAAGAGGGMAKKLLLVDATGGFSTLFSPFGSILASKEVPELDAS